MMGMRAALAVVVGAAGLIGCGGDDVPEESACGEGDDACAEVESASILGAGAASYAEAEESTNGESEGAEAIEYVLESEQGLAIEGSFEADAPSADSFLFDSGSFGGAGQPDFPGVDIQVVVDGEALDTDQGVFLSLDSVQDFGYSSLTGGYFMNAALIAGQTYVLRLTPSAALAGKSYTLELRGHVEED